MPSLDRSIVEHRLPIKLGYQPYQQGARQCNPKILPDIKAEIMRLIEANFIRQCHCDTSGVSLTKARQLTKLHTQMS